MSEFSPVAVEPFGKLDGLAECEEMPTRHLVELDPESLTSQPPLELDREEAIVTTLQDSCRHVGPPVERPRLLERRP
jgi:hypothetical protein